jgi:Skp family chaperone for outer membrane proteins
MRVKIFAILCLATVAVMMSAVQPLSAQSKVGLIDFEAALVATAEMQVEADKMEAEFTPRQDTLTALAEELSAAQQKLAAATDAQQQATLEGQAALLQRRFERDREDLQAAIDFRRDGILQRGATKMRIVLEALRVEKGFDMVINSATVYVASPTLDITTAATAAYDIAHPVAAN